MFAIFKIKDKLFAFADPLFLSFLWHFLSIWVAFSIMVTFFIFSRAFKLLHLAFLLSESPPLQKSRETFKKINTPPKSKSH